MDLGAELKEARGHRFTQASSASGHENAAACEKLILEHRFPQKELSAQLVD
jgi:hypothetical protein